MTKNTELLSQSREVLTGRWGLAIGIFIIYMLISGALNTIKYAGPVVSLIIGGPLVLGLSIVSLGLARKQDVKFEQLFDGFKRFEQALITYLWMVLYIILWSLLLIVPGIIKAMAYSQTFFLLADDPSLKPKEALEKSAKMMDGYKMKYFGLCMIFLGLCILSAITLFIGLIFIFPLMYVTTARFHDELKAEQQPLADVPSPASVQPA